MGSNLDTGTHSLATYLHDTQTLLPTYWIEGTYFWENSEHIAKSWPIYKNQEFSWTVYRY
jgi:hypothetical protein